MESREVSLLQDELQEYKTKVASLEATVRRDRDTILILRAAVAEFARRLDSLESGGVTPRKSTKPQLHRKNSSLSLSAPLTPKTPKTPKIKTLSNGKTYYDVFQKRVFVEIPPPFGPKSSSEPPGQTLKLKHAYGHSNTARHDVHHTASGAIVWSLGRVVIMQQPDSKEQKHFCGHTGEVLCVASCTSHDLVVSGQSEMKLDITPNKMNEREKSKTASKPYLCVWRASSRELVCRINHHRRGICACAVSSDGSLIVSIGMEDGSSRGAVWQWRNDTKKPIVECTVSKDRVYGVEFSPSGWTFTTFGIKHLKFWELQKKGKTWNVQGHVPETYTKTKKYVRAFLCFCYLSNGQSVAGTSEGEVYVFALSRGLHKVVKVSKKYDNPASGVSAVCAYKEGYVVGSYDGIVILSGKHEIMRKIEMRGKQAIALSIDRGVVVGGCASGDLVRVGLASEDKPQIISAGHSRKITSLTTCNGQNDHLFATGGTDAVCRVWDSVKKVVVYEHKVKKTVVNGVALHGGRAVVVSGCGDGQIVVCDYEKKCVLCVCRVVSGSIDLLSFSPNNQYLALTSDRGVVVVDCRSEDCSEWDTVKDFKGTGHTSSVTSLSWSSCGKYIASCSRDLDLLFWNVEGRGRVSVSNSVQWRRWSCVLGWAVQGIWPDDLGNGQGIQALMIGGSSANSDDKGSKVIVSGDVLGRIKLFKYPCLVKRAQFSAFLAHASPVRNVCFSKDGTRLFTAGSADVSVFEWELAQRK